MTKRLTKIGNSQGILLPKAIIDLLGITPETDLDLRVDGRVLTIQPATGARRQRFTQALDRAVNNHASTLRKLAK